MSTQIKSLELRELEFRKLELRKLESSRIRSKYSQIIPVFIKKKLQCKYDIDKNKYLFPPDFTVGQLIYTIRKRIINSSPEMALIVYFGNDKIVSASLNMEEIYDKYKNEDGFLYCTYNCENTFG